MPYVVLALSLLLAAAAIVASGGRGLDGAERAGWVIALLPLGVPMAGWSLARLLRGCG